MTKTRCVVLARSRHTHVLSLSLQIKESDINFIVKVTVINQTLDITDNATFNPIDGLDRSKFTDIYGDTFISGFQEGGEFIGVVSIKVTDSSKVTDIKAQLELGLSSVQAKGSGGYVNSDLAKGTESTISVNWSGGGRVKDRTFSCPTTSANI